MFALVCSTFPCACVNTRNPLFPEKFPKLLDFTSSWDFVIFREYWISRSRCNIWCSVRAQGWHQKTQASWFARVCTGSASINGIGPINRSEKKKRSEAVGNGRKRSETWSGQNLSNPHFFWNRHFRATPFFFWMSKGVQGETVGNSRRSHLRPAKKTCFYTIFKHCSETYAIMVSQAMRGLRVWPTRYFVQYGFEDTFESAGEI